MMTVCIVASIFDFLGLVYGSGVHQADLPPSTVVIFIRVSVMMLSQTLPPANYSACPASLGVHVDMGHRRLLSQNWHPPVLLASISENCQFSNGCYGRYLHFYRNILF